MLQGWLFWMKATNNKRERWAAIIHQHIQTNFRFAKMLANSLPKSWKNSSCNSKIREITRLSTKAKRAANLMDSSMIDTLKRKQQRMYRSIFWMRNQNLSLTTVLMLNSKSCKKEAQILGMDQEEVEPLHPQHSDQISMKILLICPGKSISRLQMSSNKKNNRIFKIQYIWSTRFPRLQQRVICILTQIKVKRFRPQHFKDPQTWIRWPRMASPSSLITWEALRMLSSRRKTRIR